jgi:predicted translation initiation factor SUI1
MSQRGRKVVLFLGPAALAGSAASAFNTVAGRMALPWVAETGDQPREAAWVVGIGSGAALAAEHWPVEAGSDATAQIEREVMHLVARLLGGGKPRDPTAVVPPPATPATPATPAPSRKGHIVRVGRETKGRRGKGVTTVSGLPLDETGLRELAGVLKQRCGTGGTVKDGVIEIQGDQRDRIIAELEKLGYTVKRAGG